MRTRTRLLTTGLVVLALGASLVGAQGLRAPAGGTRRIATLTALTTFPFFFHTQPVRIGHATEKGGLFRIDDDGAGVWLLPGPSGRMPDAGQLVDVRGTTFDVGRLERTDTQAISAFSALSQRVTNRRVAGAGRTVGARRRTRSPTARRSVAPSVRNVALDPERYLDQEVTVVGRFRGRNLYGDLPEAPGKSRWDFILQSADAAMWVTGLRPQRRRVRPERGQPRGHRTLAGGGGHSSSRSGAWYAWRRRASGVGQPPTQSAAEAIVKVADCGPAARGRLQRADAGRDRRRADGHHPGPVLPRHAAGNAQGAHHGGLHGGRHSPAGIRHHLRRRTPGRRDQVRRSRSSRFARCKSRWATGSSALDGQPLKPYTLTFSVVVEAGLQPGRGRRARPATETAQSGPHEDDEEHAR